MEGYIMSVRREREKYVRQKDTTTKAQRARSRATGPIHRPEQKRRARRAAARHRARARACNLQNISRVNKAGSRYTACNTWSWVKLVGVPESPPLGLHDTLSVQLHRLLHVKYCALVITFRTEVAAPASPPPPDTAYTKRCTR